MLVRVDGDASFLPLVVPSRYQAASALSARKHRHHAAMQVLPSLMSGPPTQFNLQHDPRQPPDVLTSIRKRLPYFHQQRPLIMARFQDGTTLMMTGGSETISSQPQALLHGDVAS
jgi:hypothetical protein